MNEVCMIPGCGCSGLASAHDVDPDGAQQGMTDAQMGIEYGTYKPTEAEMAFHDEIKRIVGEACGAVSMCWEPTPTGVFDSTSAAAFVAEAVNEIMTLPSKGMSIPEYKHVHRWSAPYTNGSAKPNRRTGQRRCLDCHAWEGEG